MFILQNINEKILFQIKVQEKEKKMKKMKNLNHDTWGKLRSEKLKTQMRFARHAQMLVSDRWILSVNETFSRWQMRRMRNG